MVASAQLQNAIPYRRLAEDLLFPLTILAQAEGWHKKSSINAHVTHIETLVMAFDILLHARVATACISV